MFKLTCRRMKMQSMHLVEIHDDIKSSQYITYVGTQEAGQTMSLRVSTLEFEVQPDGNQQNSYM